MEFLDTSNATEEEKKEILRILAANTSSVELPFDDEPIFYEEDGKNYPSSSSNNNNFISNVNQSLATNCKIVVNSNTTGNSNCNIINDFSSNGDTLNHTDGGGDDVEVNIIAHQDGNLGDIEAMEGQNNVIKNSNSVVTYLGQDGSTGTVSMASFGGAFVTNHHIGTGGVQTSATPYATVYGPKGGPMLQADNGEMLFFGHPYVSMASTSKPGPGETSMIVTSQDKIPYYTAPGPLNYAPGTVMSTISSVPVVSTSIVDTRVSIPSSSNSNSMMATMDDSQIGANRGGAPPPQQAPAGPVATVSASTGASYQMTIHPPPPPGAAYLPPAAFNPSPGAFLPVPHHMYSTCVFPVPIGPYIRFPHLTSSTTSPPASMDTNHMSTNISTQQTTNECEYYQVTPGTQPIAPNSIDSQSNLQSSSTPPPARPPVQQQPQPASKHPQIQTQPHHQTQGSQPNQTAKPIQSQPSSQKVQHKILNNKDKLTSQRKDVPQKMEDRESHGSGLNTESTQPSYESLECSKNSDSVKTGLGSNVDRCKIVNSTSSISPKSYSTSSKDNSTDISLINSSSTSTTKPKSSSYSVDDTVNDPMRKDKIVSMEKRESIANVSCVAENFNKSNSQTVSSNESKKDLKESKDSRKPNLSSLNSSSNSTNSDSSKRSWADLFKERNSSINSSLTNALNSPSFPPPSSSSTTTSNLPSCNVTSPRPFSSETPQEEAHQNIYNNNTTKCQDPSSSFKVFQEDSLATKLGRRLKDIHLKHSLPYLLPRGFVNRGNWCYINATLQALLYCPPFYNLMREIGEVPGIFRGKSSTPIVDSFAKFFSNFLPSEPMMKKAKNINFNGEDLPIGESFEPKCIYDVLGSIKSECLKGKQEDAEEFLSSVLNGLHDEIVSLFKHMEKTANGAVTANGHGNESDINDQRSNSDDNDTNLWNVVGPRHKILPTRSTKVYESPIMEIFGGSMISVRTAGNDKCGNKQPFFTLQLDIQSEKIKTVEDALKSLTSRESIHGYQCPRTKQTVEASYQTFLDQLPPILILHLKLFVYDKDGGSKKLIKKVDYKIDLELPRECLHMDRNDKNRYSKSYKLLSVVYHDGTESVKGHYLTDIFHIGSSNWLRCDDNNVKTITVQQLLNPQPPRVPYLLFYRRCDTLRGNNSSQRGSNNAH